MTGSKKVCAFVLVLTLIIPFIPSEAFSQNKMFTFTPNDGYILDTVKVDKKIVSVKGNSYMLKNIQSDHNIYATFKKIERRGDSGNKQENNSDNNSGNSSNTSDDSNLNIWVILIALNVIIISVLLVTKQMRRN